MLGAYLLTGWGKRIISISPPPCQLVILLPDTWHYVQHSIHTLTPDLHCAVGWSEQFFLIFFLITGMECPIHCTHLQASTKSRHPTVLYFPGFGNSYFRSSLFRSSLFRSSLFRSSLFSSSLLLLFRSFCKERRERLLSLTH